MAQWPRLMASTRCGGACSGVRLVTPRAMSRLGLPVFLSMDARSTRKTCRRGGSRGNHRSRYCTKCSELRLSGIRATLQTRILQAQANQESFLGYLGWQCRQDQPRAVLRWIRNHVRARRHARCACRRCRSEVKTLFLRSLVANGIICQ